MKRVPEGFLSTSRLCLARSECPGGHPPSASRPGHGFAAHGRAGAEGVRGAGAVAGGVPAAGALPLRPHLLPSPGLDPPAEEGRGGLLPSQRWDLPPQGGLRQR